MRIPIIKEGEFFHPNDPRMLAHGALQWDPDKKIPVTDQFDRGKILGWVTDIRREEGGQITGELTLRIDEKTISAGMGGIVSRDPHTFTSALLREVSMNIPIPFSIKED